MWIPELFHVKTLLLRGKLISFLNFGKIYRNNYMHSYDKETTLDYLDYIVNKFDTNKMEYNILHLN